MCAAYVVIFCAAFTSGSIAYFSGPFWLVIVCAVIAFCGTILLLKSQGTLLRSFIDYIDGESQPPSRTDTPSPDDTRVEGASGGVRVSGDLESGAVYTVYTPLLSEKK